MTPYFVTPERIQALAHAAVAWDGTPFARWGAVRGTAASCHGLVYGLLGDAGWSLGEDLPRVAASWARDHVDEVMRPWLRARRDRLLEVAHWEVPADVDLAVISAGDVLVAQLALDLVPHHMGIALEGGQAMQVLPRVAAHRVALGDPTVCSALRGVYRPLI